MKLLRDTWLMFVRYFLIFIGNPAWVIIGVIQPVLYLLLFAPLLKSLVHIPGFPPGGAYNVFVPGLLIQLGLFGASGVGFGLIDELRSGVIERFRVTPVSRLALLLGRAGRDLLTLIIQSIILLAAGDPLRAQADLDRRGGDARPGGPDRARDVIARLCGRARPQGRELLRAARLHALAPAPAAERRPAARCSSPPTGSSTSPRSTRSPTR